MAIKEWTFAKQNGRFNASFSAPWNSFIIWKQIQSCIDIRIIKSKLYFINEWNGLGRNKFGIGYGEEEKIVHFARQDAWEADKELLHTLYCGATTLSLAQPMSFVVCVLTVHNSLLWQPSSRNCQFPTRSLFANSAISEICHHCAWHVW